MNITKIATAAAVVTMTCLSATAADWQVRLEGGNCVIQSSDSVPTLGKLLVTKPTKKGACQAAKDLKTEDVADTSKCNTYRPATVTLCKGEGVMLNP